MASSGGPPEDPWERIRPAPRPSRPAPSRKTGTARRPEPAHLAAQAQPPYPPLPRPDRGRMDPLQAEGAVSRQADRAARQRVKSRQRERRARLMDRWLLRFAGGCLLLLLVGGAWWGFRQVPGEPRPSTPAVALHPESGKPAAPRVLAALQAFLEAPGPAAKSAYVLDPVRVLPLMARAYPSGRLPEAGLEFGIPLALEPGLMLVPARVAGPPEFLLHLIVQERQGQFLLDWETYEQEMTQRFASFAGRPGSPAGDFRLVIERAHAFGSGSGSDAAPAVRVAVPGSTALVQLVKVSEGARAAIIHSLPWSQRRRALVRLRWETADSADPVLMVEEVVRWDFLP